jgi:hypothetical protein
MTNTTKYTSKEMKMTKSWKLKHITAPAGEWESNSFWVKGETLQDARRNLEKMYHAKVPNGLIMHTGVEDMRDGEIA